MTALIRKFVKCAECESQQNAPEKSNSMVKNRENQNAVVNKDSITVAPTEQNLEENENAAKLRKKLFHNGVTFFTAVGCVVFPHTKLYHSRVVENRTRFTVSLYVLGMVLYTQFLYNYFDLQHPPIKLLYENPKEYNRLDNENMKFLWNELKSNCSTLYNHWTKKESDSSSETE